MLCNVCGGRYVPATGYAGDEAADVEVGDLDPVDPKIAGKADVKRMKRMLHNIQFAVRALMIITSLSTFLEEFNPAFEHRAVRRLATSERWSDHFVQLVSFGLLAPCTAGNALFVSTYFAVAKGDGSARSIFNGKEFSAQGNVPPPTNLPDVTRVLTTLEEMNRGCATVSIMEGDVRHYFHQLPLADSICRYFCLYLQGQFYSWRSLPMGWSFSPFVAQSIGMGLILEALRRTNYDVKEFGASNTPPSMIVIRNEEDKIEILACLWYDNVLIACRDPQRAPKIFAQYRKVCSEVHLELKSWTFHGPRSMNPTSSGGGKDPSYPSYLGLEFCRLRKRDRDDPPLQLHWRIANKRLLEWEDLRENIRRRMTCRTVAKIAGVALWRSHIFLTPLCRMESLIELVRKCGVLCHKQSQWDLKRTWTPGEQATLRSALEVAVTREWATVPVKALWPHPTAQARDGA